MKILFETIHNISSILRTQSLTPFLSSLSQPFKDILSQYSLVHPILPPLFLLCFREEIKPIVLQLHSSLSSLFSLSSKIGKEKFSNFFYIYRLLKYFDIDNLSDNFSIPRNKISDIPISLLTSLRSSFSINHTSTRLKEIILSLNIILSTLGFSFSTSEDPSVKRKRKFKVINSKKVDVNFYFIIPRYPSLFSCIS